MNFVVGTYDTWYGTRCTACGFKDFTTARDLGNGFSILRKVNLPAGLGQIFGPSASGKGLHSTRYATNRITTGLLPYCTLLTA